MMTRFRQGSQACPLPSPSFPPPLPQRNGWPNPMGHPIIPFAFSSFFFPLQPQFLPFLDLSSATACMIRQMSEVWVSILDFQPCKLVVCVHPKLVTIEVRGEEEATATGGGMSKGEQQRWEGGMTTNTFPCGSVSTCPSYCTYNNFKYYAYIALHKQYISSEDCLNWVPYSSYSEIWTAIV